LAVERKKIEMHLNLLEMQVLESRKHIANQRRLIAELQEAGRYTADSRKLLLAFERLLQIQEADRERIRKELAKLK
jgi:hypothetical protein